MKALLFERKPARYAAAIAAGRWTPGGGARVGPLRLADIDPPDASLPGWRTLIPRLAGICGSDLATIDGRSSRYFEPIVSFPFVPGHEVVADDPATGKRFVVQPTLTCAARGVEPLCPSCADGATNLCQRLAFGHLEPGLQVGFCTDTSGGWSTALTAHESQLHEVPAALSDEAAVMVEPAACAVHAANQLSPAASDVAVLGAGTVGLLTTAAIRARAGGRVRIMTAAKHPEQRRMASHLGADDVVQPDQIERLVRSVSGSLRQGNQLTGGAAAVFDCVGSEDSLTQALRIVAPGGTIHVVGMPGPSTSVDLTGLWHREVAIRGCYAYVAGDFEAAFGLVGSADLGRLVSATYPLARYRDAIEHAANAGRRGAVKIAFDLRNERKS